jgi:hypothetical protein
MWPTLGVGVMLAVSPSPAEMSQASRDRQLPAWHRASLAQQVH